MSPNSKNPAPLARGRAPNSLCFAVELIESASAVLGVPINFIAPSAWKRLVGLPAGRDGAKDAARSEASRRWPDKAGLFARVRDEGRADAALISVAGLIGERRR